MSNQVKSKYRVSTFGEVNTSFHAVRKIINLVGNEANRYGSKFLDPACGDGNILLGLLDRKLSVLEKKNEKDSDFLEKRVILTIASLYGIDKLKDNTTQARHRIINKFDNFCTKVFGSKARKNIIHYVKHIVDKNIIFGDTLLLQDYTSGEEIIFYEWRFCGQKIKKIAYSLKENLSGEKKKISV